ncbi:MAG TPA: hypothetical protein VGG72_00870 [Bryobacteraceae bacterium]
MAVLESVARAYAGLKTLSVEMLSVTESNHAGSSNRGGQRNKAWFESPDRVRIETGGRNGMVLVTDGIDWHTFFTLPKRYLKRSSVRGRPLPGEFRPEHAALFGNPPVFLFPRIAERVKSTEILARDGDSILISVAYEEPDHPLVRLSSPVQYSIDAKTHLVSRIEGEVSMRMPAQDETTVRKHAVSFANAVVDEPFAADVFTFVPPADAVEGPRGRGGFIGGGGGGFVGSGRKGRFENRHSHEWEGDTLVQTYTLRMHGIDVTFERRLTFSEDRSELKVSETISGPAGTLRAICPCLWYRYGTTCSSSRIGVRPRGVAGSDRCSARCRRVRVHGLGPARFASRHG